MVHIVNLIPIKNGVYILVEVSFYISNILNQKCVQNKIPPCFQYKKSPCIPIAIPDQSSITKQVCSNSTFKVFPRIPKLATALIHNFGTLHVAI